jgi:WD40 repeat protein
MEGHKGQVKALAFSPCGKFLASGGEDKSIILWDFEIQAPIFTLTGHAHFVQTLDFHGDGRIASGSTDKKVIIWSFERMEETKRLEEFARYVITVKFTLDGEHLVVAVHNHKIQIFNKEYAKTQELDSVTFLLQSIHLSQDGRYLAHAYKGEVKLYDAMSFALVKTLFKQQTQCNSSVEFSPNCQFLVVIHRLPRSTKVDLVRVQDFTRVSLNLELRNQVYFSAFSADSCRLAFSCDSKKSLVYDCKAFMLGKSASLQNKKMAKDIQQQVEKIKKLEGIAFIKNRSKPPTVTSSSASSASMLRGKLFSSPASIVLPANPASS